MAVLLNLEGTEVEETTCLFIYKPTDIECILKNGYAATAADSNGAINIWEDSDGKIRVERMRHYATMDKKILETYEEAVKWVKEAIEEIK